MRSRRRFFVGSRTPTAVSTPVSRNCALPWTPACRMASASPQPCKMSGRPHWLLESYPVAMPSSSNSTLWPPPSLPARGCSSQMPDASAGTPARRLRATHAPESLDSCCTNRSSSWCSMTLPCSAGNRAEPSHAGRSGRDVWPSTDGCEVMQLPGQGRSRTPYPVVVFSLRNQGCMCAARCANQCWGSERWLCTGA